MVTWFRKISCGKLKPLFLHYHSAYNHQTWQDNDLPWTAPTHKVTRPFGHIVKWPLIRWSDVDHVTVCVSIFTKLMGLKTGRILTSDRRFSTQTPMLKSISCFFYSFLSLYLDGLLKVIFKFLSNCWLKSVWPGSQLLIWYAVCFQAISLRDKR